VAYIDLLLPWFHTHTPASFFTIDLSATRVSIATHLSASTGRIPSSSTRHLTEAMLDTQTKIATEPRDKIFAVRSLYLTVLGSLEINYNKTVATVYAEATGGLIEFTQDLSLLNVLCCGPAIADAPSWTIDWSDYVTFYWELYRPYPWFAVTPESFNKPLASADRSIPERRKPRFSFDGMRLCIPGAKVDVVLECYERALPVGLKHCIAPNQFYPGWREQFLARIGVLAVHIPRNWVNVILGRRSSKSSFPDSDTLWARMVQFFGHESEKVGELTKILKLVMTDNPRESFPEEFDATKKTLQDNGFEPIEMFNSPPLDLDIFTAIMVRSETMAELAWTFFFLESQRIFVTESGEMCLSRHDIRPNDSLMLLQTASAPFIVRTEGGRKRVIGPVKMLNGPETYPLPAYDDPKWEELEIS